METLGSALVRRVVDRVFVPPAPPPIPAVLAVRPQVARDALHMLAHLLSVLSSQPRDAPFHRIGYPVWLADTARRAETDDVRDLFLREYPRLDALGRGTVVVSDIQRLARHLRRFLIQRAKAWDHEAARDPEHAVDAHARSAILRGSLDELCERYPHAWASAFAA